MVVTGSNCGFRYVRLNLCHFTPVIVLCDPLRGLDNLFDQFLTICIYFYSLLVYVGRSIVTEPTPFSFIISSTPFFLLDQELK
jgi:hypothetical protein